MEYLARMGCSEFSECLDRRETSFPGCLGVVDVPKGDLNSDVSPLAKGGDLDYRNTAFACGGEAKRRVGGNRRRNEDRPTPAGRLQKAMEPSHRDRLGIESDQPRKGADLSPNISNFSSNDLRCPQILCPTARDASQQQRNHAKPWRCAARSCEQTRKTSFVGSLPFLNPCRNMPTTRLQLGAWRCQTVCDLLP